MPYKIIIHAEGSIEESKVKPALAAGIENKIKEISPDAVVTVDFRVESSNSE